MHSIFILLDNRGVLEKITVGKRNCLIIPDEICNDDPRTNIDHPLVVWNSRELTRVERQVIAMHSLTGRDSPNISSHASQAENEYCQLYRETALRTNFRKSLDPTSQSEDREQSVQLLDSDDDSVTQEIKEPLPASRRLCLLNWIRSFFMNIILFFCYWFGIGNARVLLDLSAGGYSEQKQKTTPQVAAYRRRASKSNSTSYHLHSVSRPRTRAFQHCSPRQTVDNKRLLYTRKVNRIVVDVADWREGGNDRMELIPDCGVFLWKKQLSYIKNHHDDDPWKLGRGLLHGIIPLNSLKRMTVAGMGKDRIPMPPPVLEAIYKFIRREMPSTEFKYNKLKTVLNYHFKALRT